MHSMQAVTPGRITLALPLNPVGRETSESGSVLAMKGKEMFTKEVHHLLPHVQINMQIDR